MGGFADSIASKLAYDLSVPELVFWTGFFGSLVLLLIR